MQQGSSTLAVHTAPRGSVRGNLKRRARKTAPRLCTFVKTLCTFMNMRICAASASFLREWTAVNVSFFFISGLGEASLLVLT